MAPFLRALDSTHLIRVLFIQTQKARLLVNFELRDNPRWLECNNPNFQLACCYSWAFNSYWRALASSCLRLFTIELEVASLFLSRSRKQKQCNSFAPSKTSTGSARMTASSAVNEQTGACWQQSRSLLLLSKLGRLGRIRPLSCGMFAVIISIQGRDKSCKLFYYYLLLKN